MRWNRKRRALLEEFEQRMGEHLAEAQDRAKAAWGEKQGGISLAMTAALATITLAVLAGGLYTGRELRSRYKLKRRTPYDYYAHSGDRTDLEFGVGI